MRNNCDTLKLCDVSEFDVDWIMKKFICVLLALAFLMIFTICGGPVLDLNLMRFVF